MITWCWCWHAKWWHKAGDAVNFVWHFCLLCGKTVSYFSRKEANLGVHQMAIDHVQWILSRREFDPQEQILENLAVQIVAGSVPAAWAHHMIMWCTWASTTTQHAWVKFNAFMNKNNTVCTRVQVDPHISRPSLLSVKKCMRLVTLSTYRRYTNNSIYLYLFINQTATMTRYATCNVSHVPAVPMSVICRW